MNVSFYLTVIFSLQISISMSIQTFCQIYLFNTQYALEILRQTVYIVAIL